jgi:hypothetical protein
MGIVISKHRRARLLDSDDSCCADEFAAGSPASQNRRSPSAIAISRAKRKGLVRSAPAMW